MGQDKTSAVVIMGAGMTGMLAALYIRHMRPGLPVVIVEPSGHAGGHYRGLSLEGFGYCDPAMRMIYETGIPDLDGLIHALLPADAWHLFPDNEKDIAGIYWQGGLQTHSPYIDLRRLPEPVYRQCEAEIRRYLDAPLPRQQAVDAERHLYNRFGPTTAQYLCGALEKLYRIPASCLDVSATRQPAMDRVVLYDETQMKQVMTSESMRSVIAWPDQLTLPIKRNPPQSALYPKTFGIQRVIDAMQNQLQEQGVECLWGRRIAQLEMVDKRIKAVILDDGSRLQHPALFICAGGLQAAAHMLRIESHLAAPSSAWLVFVRSTHMAAMGRLYHAYCFDEGYATFRVTNYANYCADARNAAGYPLCVELWSDDADAAQAIARATDELRRMQLLPEDARITAQAAHRSVNLHALCTREIAQSMQRLREQIADALPENMLAAGPFTGEETMLLYGVWRDMYRKLTVHL